MAIYGYFVCGGDICYFLYQAYLLYRGIHIYIYTDSSISMEWFVGENLRIAN